MLKRFRQKHSQGQTAIEYLLLLILMVLIFFLAFGRGLLEQIGEFAGGYFNKASEEIMGPPPP